MKKRDMELIIAEYNRIIEKDGCPFVISDFENLYPREKSFSLYDLISDALKYGYVVGIRQERYKRQRLAKKARMMA